jgi:hypothetical protein
MVKSRIMRKDGVVQRYNVKSVQSLKKKGYVYDRKNHYWIKPVRVLTEKGIREKVVKPDKLKEYVYDEKRDLYYKPTKFGKAEKPRRVTVCIYVRYDSSTNYVEIDSHVTFEVKKGENIDELIEDYREKLIDFLEDIFDNLQYLMANGVVKEDEDLDSDMQLGYLVRWRHSKKRPFKNKLYNLNGILMREWYDWKEPLCG